MRRIIFLLLIAFASKDCIGQSFGFASSVKSGGTGNDTNNPGITFTYPDAVVFGAINPTITITKSPISGLDASDFTVVNCVASSVTRVGVDPSNTYTVTITPTNDGAFSFSVGANKFIDAGGRNNTASNTMNLTYIKDVAVHNIQLATMYKALHWKNADATFSTSTDVGTTASGEMLCLQKNFGAISFYGSYSQLATDISSMGRVSLGNYVQCNLPVNGPLGTFTTADPNITLDRGGAPPTALGYKDGNSSCASNFKQYLLYARNSGPIGTNYAATCQNDEYTGLTDDQMINRCSTFRIDYWLPGTNSLGVITPNWSGAKAWLDTNVPLKISGHKWFTNFNHWVYNYQEYPVRFYSYLYDTLLAGQNVARIPSDKAAEYMWLRDAVDSIKGSGRTITVYRSKKYPGSPYNRITVPLWVYLDLSATNYAGTGIAVVFGGTGAGKVINLGGDKYVVSVKIDMSLSSSTFDIVNTTSPTYVSTTPATMSLSSNTATSDLPVKVALYSLSMTNVGSSSSSIATPTSHPSIISPTVSTGLTLPVGTMIKLYNSSTHYICGKVMSYNSGTGALVMRSDGNVGTGTFSSWTVYKAGYEIDFTLTERQLTSSTSHVLTTTLTPTTKYYQLGHINDDDQSATKHF